MRATKFVALCIGIGIQLFATRAMSMNIVDAVFDAKTDELVFTVLYQGTHENHTFTVQWEECRRMEDGHLEILGIVQDSDPNDLARTDFSKTERISLTNFSCRPGIVTIGAPSWMYRQGVKVPARKPK